MSTEHDEATSERDAILARQRANEPRPERERQREGERLYRALARVDTRLVALDEAVAARAAYLADHPDEVAAYPLVRRAELARELEIRAAAAVTPPHVLIQLTGGPPTNPIARRAWTDAAELIAVHAERHGFAEGTAVGDPVEQALGERPSDHIAAASWCRVADAVRASLDVLDSDVADDLAITLPESNQPELSLFD
jgi:hypothetical protein